MFNNGILRKCQLWKKNHALQCRLRLGKYAFRNYCCQFLPLHTLGFYMYGAKQRIQAFFFGLTILQDASKVLDAIGSNFFLMFLISSQFKEEPMLPLVKLWRLKRLTSNCNRCKTWHMNVSLAIMRLLLHKLETIMSQLILKITSFTWMAKALVAT